MSLLLVVAAAGAQSLPVLEVGPDRLVSEASEPFPVVEPQLAVDPTDPGHLLATAMVAAVPLPAVGEGLAAESICATWVSRDGGEHWTRRDQLLAGCADPWVAIAGDGTALFTGLGSEDAAVFRAADGGSAWEPAASLGGGHDHPTLVVDRSEHSPFTGAAYFVSGRGGVNDEGQARSTVFVARSSDGGRSFPSATETIASNLSYESQLPAVLSDGTLLVPFSDHHTLRGDRLAIGARRSWLLRSRDGGVTFSEPLFVTDRCDGRGGWPMLAAGPDDGLWFLCVAADSHGILVFRSADRGESWQGPSRPDGQNSAADSYTRTPALAVSRSGVVAVAWYDRRDDPERACQHLYFTASADRGQTFVPPARVSGQPSCPDTPANDWTAGRFPAGGDYMGLVSTGAAEFRVLWSDARDGIYRLRSASVTASVTSDSSASD